MEWRRHGTTEELGKKTCPDATLSTKNPTLDVTGLKQGLRVETPAANRLNGGLWHCRQVEASWNVTVHGDKRDGKWRGNRRVEWLASTLHTTSEHGVSSITTADAARSRMT
jgi:hypothetical protein